MFSVQVWAAWPLCQCLHVQHTPVFVVYIALSMLQIFACHRVVRVSVYFDFISPLRTRKVLGVSKWVLLKLVYLMLLALVSCVCTCICCWGSDEPFCDEPCEAPPHRFKESCSLISRGRILYSHTSKLQMHSSRIMCTSARISLCLQQTVMWFSEGLVWSQFKVPGTRRLAFTGGRFGQGAL